MKPIKNNVLFTSLAVLILLLLPLTFLANELNHTDWPETNSPAEAAQLFAQGREAFEMGRINDAILHFDEAVQKDAQYAVAWLYKALTAQTDADRKASIGKAVRFRNNATEEERMLIDIELTYADNNSEKRFQLAKQLAELHPENARALLVLAGEFQKRGEISKFRDLASEAIRVEPNSPLGYRALAASWVLNEPIDLQLAGKYMQKFVELRPGEASAHIARGDVYRAFLDLANAEKAFSKAIEIEPENAVALAKRGYIHTYLGNLEEARTDFNKATALVGHKQDYSKPNFSMVSYLFPGNGKTTATDEEFFSNMNRKNKKIPLNGASDNCYFCRSVISMNHGFVATPDESMNTCCCLRHEFDVEGRVPDESTIEANFAFMRGFRALQDGNYEKTKQLIEEYANAVSPGMKPGKNEAHNFLLGVALLNQGKYSKALAQFKKSDTSNIFVKYNMAVAYDELGKYEEAKNEFTEVADLNFSLACFSPLGKIAKVWLKSYEDSSLAQK
ncbi:tetratricopeptide repeat protein [Mariniphaga sp.]|uniref:tetratricopeptide repeat protein n=1 Tax=Mariniphaga sp. TaxID=1954475 RepID=UPI00356B4B1B